MTGAVKGGSVEVVVGRIGRPHGVAGAVLVDVRTDEPERRFAPATVFTTASGPLEVLFARPHGHRLAVRFTGVDDRDAAERLRGVELTLSVPVDEQPDDPEEYYDHQLVGLEVTTESGDRVGGVTEVLHLPAQDVLVVTGDAGQRLVPFVRALVPTVDLTAGRVVVLDRAVEE